eukprot:gnl/MRDRNA2_/MRDRNA2_71972_c0_seq1.p1 gnl/MRDRNA2_/MRDRNA2_71972_c0~~gnl/MRDRNA2_/MRDRNA2_71972_c0_seq1.p1  ORF type:complete len:107 (-),score=2.89 gnl/MRDRNA2_/MRDRNA2_71972_c0_seq1:37-357(-)
MKDIFSFSFETPRYMNLCDRCTQSRRIRSFIKRFEERTWTHCIDLGMATNIFVHGMKYLEEEHVTQCSVAVITLSQMICENDGKYRHISGFPLKLHIRINLFLQLR